MTAANPRGATYVKSVMSRDAAKNDATRLGRTLERSTVHGTQAILDLEARFPFEIVHERPVHVSQDRYPLADRFMKTRDCCLDVPDASLIVVGVNSVFLKS